MTNSSAVDRMNELLADEPDIDPGLALAYRAAIATVQALVDAGLCADCITNVVQGEFSDGYDLLADACTRFAPRG